MSASATSVLPVQVETRRDVTGRQGLIWQLLSDALASVAVPGATPSVLDCGGGSGSFAVPLARAGALVTVVDISVDALATLRRRAGDAGVGERVEALQGDVVLHWHGDTFDLPRDATRLASNANYENQAFAYGRNALGLQFHLEADPRQLEEWYVGHAVELAAAGISIADLRAATHRHANGLMRRADGAFSAWLAQFDREGVVRQPKVKA